MSGISHDMTLEFDLSSSVYRSLRYLRTHQYKMLRLHIDTSNVTIIVRKLSLGCIYIMTSVRMNKNIGRQCVSEFIIFIRTQKKKKILHVSIILTLGCYSLDPRYHWPDRQRERPCCQ